VRLIIIQDVYSQRAVRLKTVEKYIAIFAVKISFSQRYDLITFLFSNLIKEVLNSFVYIYCILLMLNSHCIYACFGSMNMTFKVALKYSGVNCTFLQGN
jgi:hypothetical protein